MDSSLKQYILREQTKGFLEEARRDFSSQHAPLPSDPTEIITSKAHYSNDSGSCLYQIQSSPNLWVITKEVFCKYYIPYYADDNHLLDQL